MATAVETIIADNSTWLNPVPQFFLADKWWFNESSDKQELWPVMLLDNDVKESFEVNQNANYSIYALNVMLLNRFENNDTDGLIHNPQIGSSRQLLVSSMRDLAKAFIECLALDSRVSTVKDAISNVQIVAVYNVFDSNLDGVNMTFSLKVLSDKYCFTRHSAAKV